LGTNVTPEEQAKFKELNRLRMKMYRDKKRVRKYTPRKKGLRSMTAGEPKATCGKYPCAKYPAFSCT